MKSLVAICEGLLGNVHVGRMAMIQDWLKEHPKQTWGENYEIKNPSDPVIETEIWNESHDNPDIWTEPNYTYPDWLHIITQELHTKLSNLHNWYVGANEVKKSIHMTIFENDNWKLADMSKLPANLDLSLFTYSKIPARAFENNHYHSLTIHRSTNLKRLWWIHGLWSMNVDTFVADYGDWVLAHGSILNGDTIKTDYQTTQDIAEFFSHNPKVKRWIVRITNTDMIKRKSRSTQQYEIIKQLDHYALQKTSKKLYR